MTAPTPGTALPIDRHLEAITASLPPGATVLLQAPPGAGKTTRVPLALMESLGERDSILMLEPRRLAARGAAERMAAVLGESVGERVGYSVRLESRSSAATRLEVLTSGLYLRRLQADPALEGVACVIFDELHERAAELDLALALTRQARELLRPDLRLLLMSATLDLEPLAARLDGARVISSGGRSFPVEVLHQPPRPDERLEQQLLRALEQHWLDQRGKRETVLVFLPGQREIRDAERAILSRGWAADLECCALHGQLPLAAQRRAIAPAAAAAGKLVLATSIAESSLTIEGVRLVIDSGLSRISRFDPGTGMDGLVTVPASQASAEQRRGRAGRLAPGRCLRLWSPAEQQRRPPFELPELLQADPLPLALQLAAWGSGLGDDLAWLDPPPQAPLLEARRLLGELEALDDEGAITPHGRTMAALGLHPRLAHMLLRADGCGCLELACCLAVLIGERDPLDRRTAGSDLRLRLDWLRAGRGERGPLLRLQAQLMRQVRACRSSAAGERDAPRGGGRPPQREAEDLLVARLLSWAYPERLALGRGQQDGRFLLRSGRGARLPAEDPLAAEAALAIATVDGQGSDARVLLAVPLPVSLLEELADQEGVSESHARWDERSERVRCERVRRLGALELERHPWPIAETGAGAPASAEAAAMAAAVRTAMEEGLRRLGIEALPWCRRSRRLQQRLALAHHHLGEPWPARDLEALANDPAGWLGPWLEGMRSRQDLQALDLIEALWGAVPWEQRSQLERLLPEDLPVPSGRRVPIDYSGSEPVLAMKLQEMFGATGTPTLLEGRLPVTVHLLSPAGRPGAITRDLAGFWRSGYAEVRRELRGRYPKHPWPDDPLKAVATALTKARLQPQS
ncbi:MAG: ATP-dependent helicase HrpB [Cyanobium sp.]